MDDQQEYLAQMLVAMVEARERESARVSRLLHDEVGQVLSAVGLQLGVLRLDFQQDTPEIAARAVEIQGLLEQAVTQVRDLSYELNPAVVEKAGLQFALERLLGTKRAADGASLRLLYDARAPVRPASAVAVHKLVEMALDNALRHSQATEIQVVVRPTSAGVVSEVRDNGVGFAPEAEQGRGLGLLLMRTYAQRAGVLWHLRSAPGKGTVVRITCPAGQSENKNEKPPRE